MGVGPTPKQQGAIRLSLDAVSGFGMDGGHLEDKGLSAAGRVQSVPVHRHRVLLDYTRVELGLDLTVLENWDLRLRVPYEVKTQSAGIETVAPATFDQVVAMARNRALHHPRKTFHGISDLSLTVAHRRFDLFAEGDSLGLALGVTIPTGQTERDPYERGQAGLPHVHFQFGTGTVDPLAELTYRLPLPLDLAASTSLFGRFPLYENRKGYRGSLELTHGLGLSYRVAEWLVVGLEHTTLWQGAAHWKGDRDVNSGLVALSWALTAAIVPPGTGLTIALGVRLPHFQETLSGEAFEQGIAASLSLAWQRP